MDVAPPARDLAHRLHDLRVGRLLEHVAARARRERLAHVPRVVLHREHQHLRVGRLLQHRRRRLDPALPGHDDVHQDHVRLVRARLEDGVADVARLADDLDVVLGLEHAAQAGADDGMVVDDQHADRHAIGHLDRRASCRRRARTRPRAGRRASATRSRIPSKPEPARVVAAPPKPAAVVLDHGRDAAVPPRERRC